MKKSIEIELPKIEMVDSTIKIPDGWFCQYHIKTILATETLRKRLSKMEQDGILEGYMGHAKINGNLRRVKLYRKI